MAAGADLLTGVSTAHKYFQPGEERAERVKALFARIANRYDFLNDLQSFGLHRLWKRRLLKMAAPQRGEHALDVCCGTGDIALALVQAGMEVTGLDFSAQMLTVAAQRQEMRQAGLLAPIRWVQGDAMSLPFPDASFEIVTIGYGLRNLADWQTGLREMWRVARPGGRVLVLDFAKPDFKPWRALYFAYLRCVVPMFGKLFCGDWQAYSYILESLKDYPAQHSVNQALHELQGEQVQCVALLGGVMSINYARKPILRS